MNRPLALVALVTVAAAFLAMPALAAPAADGFRIRYAERLATSAKPAADGAWQFSAQGKAWSARLKPNAALLAQVKTLAPGIALPAVWKGQLDGLPGSWVRLTEGATGTWGTVWDGSDLYFIEPAADAAPFLIDAGATQGSVVYRASDTQLDPTVKLCPVAVLPPNSRLAAAAGVNTPLRTAPATKTGLDSYRALMAEIAPPTAAATLTGRLRVSLVADFEYQQRFGTTGATDRMIARFNTIDGFFSSQVGVQIEVASVRIFDVIDDPFTSSVSNTLLTELANWRAGASQAALRADSGITHLVTGRDLDGTTVGIAYVGALCSNNFGAGLSEGDSSTRSNLTSTLIAAHELGHNFGAPHDGEASTTGTANPCEAVAQTFLMAPRLNGSSTFSQCSLDQIAPEVASARCLLAPVTAVDLSLTMQPNFADGVAVGATTTTTARVTNVGSASASAATLDVTLPTGLEVQGSGTGVTCSAVAATTLHCELGALAGEATRNVTLTFTPRAAGALVATVQVGAAGDSSAANDTASFTVTAVPSIDLVGTLTSPAATNGLRVGATSTADFSVRNAGASDATNVSVVLAVSAGMKTRGTATLATGTCTTELQRVTCTLARLAAGATVAGNVGLEGVSTGPNTLRLTSTATEPDGTPVDTTVNVSVSAQTTPDPPPPASGSGGGGGGAMDGLTLSALALLALLAMAGRRGAPRRARAPSRAPRAPRGHLHD